MIDEYLTKWMFGYTIDTLEWDSKNKIVVDCDQCRDVFYITMKKYNKDVFNDLCHKCVRKQKQMIYEKRLEVDPKFAARETKRTRQSIDVAWMWERIERGERDYTDYKSRMAAMPYCEKFDEDCKDRNRAKYGYRCFLCNKPTSENKTKFFDVRELSVHHIDLNKDQGCNDHDWSLVPLCMSCHGKAHTNVWQARIEYLLDHVWHTESFINT